jgi:hypothetical protein
VGRTLLSDAFDVDLAFAEDDLAEDEQDARSTVKERRFSAAISRPSQSGTLMPRITLGKGTTSVVPH